MEHRGKDIEVVERILAAGSRVTVVLGPAAGGKTAAALGVYRQYVDPAGRPRARLLAPNQPTVESLKRRLLTESPNGVVVAPAVRTFAALAGSILAAAADETRPASAFQRRLLLGRIVAELHAAGEFQALGSVADTPGLIDALDRAIAELKRAAVEPDHLAAAIGEGRDKRADLLAVYRRYQEELHRTRTFDVEGHLWLAREHLARAAAAGEPPPGLAGVAALVADGFTDFTPTQLEILRLLSGWAERVVITLPYAADDGRGRMWHWTDRTLQDIRRSFGEDLAEVVLDRGVEPRAPLRSVIDGVFRPDAPGALPPGVAVVSAPGIDAEVAAAARRVKALLHAGTPAGHIGVLARSMEVYGEAIRRIFREHDIPVPDPPVPLTDVPVVRYVLAAASLGPELAWQDCLRVVKSSYFRPGALGEYDEATVAAAEALIREGNVLAGRESYEAAAGRLAARAEARKEAEDEAPTFRLPLAAAIRQAGEMLGKLFDLAEGASDAARLAELIDALDLPAAARAHGLPALVARDLRALAVLRSCLSALPDPAPEPTRVREALAAVSCPAARGESLVDVLDVLDARALRYDHLLLLGVSERQFPPRHTEGSLLGEADREDLRRRGFAVARRQDLTAREMLLFYLAISRAERTLTLSYLESDASGTAGSPSGFLLAVLGGEGIGGGHVRRITAGDVLPPVGELAAPRDALNAGMVALFRDADGGYDAAARWAVASRPERVRRAAMGIWARHRRWQAGECNEFDGRISDAKLLGALARRYPRETLFSAGQLGTYGQCPWRHFAQYVLHLDPLAEPERRLEPQSRGVFCHNVLFRLLRALAGQADGPVRLDQADEGELADLLDDAVAAEARRVEATQPPYPLLWQIQLAQMRRDLWEYVARSRTEHPPAESLHFELSFGRALDDAEAHDPASRSEPVTVSTPAGGIRLRGRIDRVDRVAAAGAEGLLVVDYKTGRLPTPADFHAGRNLQAPLYARAAEALLGEAGIGGAFHRIGQTHGARERYFAAVSLSRGRLKANESYADELDAALETAGRFVRGMSAGRFDAVPTHDCPGWCPYRRICHYAPARAEVKTGPAADEEGA